MQIKTILLVSSVILSISSMTPVTYDISFQEKYISSDEEPPREIDATFNGMPIMRTQFLMNRIKVTAVIIDENEPSASNFVSVYPEYDLRSENPKDNTEFEGESDLDLPSFEVEYGREPLEYLLSMLKSKYGLDVAPNSMVGMANQYGYSLKSSELSQYPGSKLADYNMDADSVDSLMGPLIGLYTTTTSQSPNQIEQTTETSQYEWDEEKHHIPVTNIIYLLNVNKEILDDEEFSRYGQALNFKEKAKLIIENMNNNDMNYILSRVIFSENSLKRADVFEVNSSINRLLV